MDAADRRKLDRDQLQMLYDYTKFHVGLYATLNGSYLAFVSSTWGKHIIEGQFAAVCAATILLVAAGICGGLIASSAPFATGMDQFLNAKLAPFVNQAQKCGLPCRWVIQLEHMFFWSGVAVALTTIVTGWRSGEAIRFACARVLTGLPG